MACTLFPRNSSKCPSWVIIFKNTSCFWVSACIFYIPLGQAALLLPCCGCWGLHLQHVLVLDHPGTCILCLPWVKTCVQRWKGGASTTGEGPCLKVVVGVQLPVDSLHNFKLWLPYSRPWAKARVCISLGFFGLEILCIGNFLNGRIKDVFS